MNNQLDKILDFCFEGDYKESMENIDKRKAEASENFVLKEKMEMVAILASQWV